MPFKELWLIEPILKALEEQWYTTPTPIQQQSIPVILAGKDLFGSAQTGTGKTASFALPILQILYTAKKNGQTQKGIKSLILTPTRELAIQINESFADYGKYMHLRHTVVFGGVSQHHQVKALQAGVDILVATPGRLLDLMNQGYIDLKEIQLFVLDEADRMLDMWFIHDVKKVVAKLPPKKQSLFFSATMPPAILQLAHTILHTPEKIVVAPVASTVDTVEQSVYFVGKHDKKALLIHLLKDATIVNALVFTRTKHGANKLTKGLNDAGITTLAIHGNKSQSSRQKALESLKNKSIRVLVATDVAARGIDIDLLSHVIIFDVPHEPETYVHRIGRTARAGASGIAISFCDQEEKKDLAAIEKLIKQKIPVVGDHPFPLTQTSVRQASKPTASSQHKPTRNRRKFYRR